jgi:hypothetical protein
MIASFSTILPLHHLGLLWVERMLPACGDSAARVPAGRFALPTIADSTCMFHSLHISYIQSLSSPVCIASEIST